jgi:hypothetical protein
VKTFGFVLLVLLLFYIFSSCCIRQKEAVFNETKEIELVRQSIDNVIGWAVSKDFSLFFGSI